MFKVNSVKLRTDGACGCGCGPMYPGIYSEIEIDCERGTRYVLAERIYEGERVSVHTESAIDFVLGIMSGEIEDDSEIELFDDNAIELYDYTNDEPEDLSDSPYFSAYKAALEVLDAVYEDGIENIEGTEKKMNKKYAGQEI